jgi:preprotein translocase subunit SecB
MNHVDTPVKSNLVLNKMYFSEMRFTRERDIASGNLSLSLKSSVSRADNEYRVELRAEINHSEKALFASLCMIGVFSFSDDKNEMNDEIAHKNTLSIMFPYLRSQLSLLSTQPDMNPITLPPININDFVDRELKLLQEASKID